MPKSCILSLFRLFWAYFGVWCVFLSCRGSCCSEELRSKQSLAGVSRPFGRDGVSKKSQQGLQSFKNRVENQMFETFQNFDLFLVDVSAPKKYLAPPPPKNPQFAPDTLPAPRPLPLLETPPLLGFSIKADSPPPSWRLGLALPPPRAEKKIIYPKRPPSF